MAISHVVHLRTDAINLMEIERLAALSLHFLYSYSIHTFQEMHSFPSHCQHVTVFVTVSGVQSCISFTFTFNFLFLFAQLDDFLLWIIFLWEEIA